MTPSLTPTERQKIALSILILTAILLAFMGALANLVHSTCGVMCQRMVFAALHAMLGVGY